MPQKTVDILKKGIEANHTDSFRKGNMVTLPGEGEVIVTGDLHGHRRNFERIVNYTNLADNPQRHVILQEIIHGGPEDEHGGCLSYQLLLDVVRYKLDFPDRVHIILGNHDTAFINNSEVIKGGKEANISMRSALKRRYSNATEDVELAIRQFLFSQPLAVKCANGIFIAHSLPADRFVEKFDPAVLDKKLKVNDIVRPHSAYLLTWGRRQSQKTLDKMAEMLGADVFILGHQPQDTGWAQGGSNLLIIASDHNHGCILPIDLAKSYTITDLIDGIVPLASVS